MATKKKKYPKRPKASSSLQVWQNFERRCKEVDRLNKQAEQQAKQKKALIERTKRR